MSNVPERKRKPASTQYETTAKDIDFLATKLSVSAIPKSHRFTIGVPMTQAASSIVENVLLAKESYPSNALAAYDRKRFISAALVSCKMVKRYAEKATSLKVSSVASFEDLINKIDEEMKMLRSVKNSIKVKDVEDEEDQIKWHRLQIEALYDLMNRDQDQDPKSD